MPASWTYAAEQAVTDLLGTVNLSIGQDLDDDGNADAGLLQRDGERSDGYINLELARHELTVPVNLATAPAHVVTALEDISAHLTVWYLWHHRGVQESMARNSGQPSDIIAGIMGGYKAYADEQLAKLIETLVLEDEEDVATPAGGFSFVPITRPTCVTDENAA